MAMNHADLEFHKLFTTSFFSAPYDDFNSHFESLARRCIPSEDITTGLLAHKQSSHDVILSFLFLPLSLLSYWCRHFALHTPTASDRRRLVGDVRKLSAAAFNAITRGPPSKDAWSAISDRMSTLRRYQRDERWVGRQHGEGGKI